MSADSVCRSGRIFPRPKARRFPKVDSFRLSGLYGLTWSPELTGRCDMAVDRTANELYCKTSAERWDRIGRPLGGKATERLRLVPAKLGWDGHLLLSTTTSIEADGSGTRSCA